LWVVMSTSLAAVVGSRASAAPIEVPLPRRSPLAHVTQEVGLTSISVDYNSPAVAGRRIWGSVIQPGALWRTGEGVIPKISFSRDVRVADRPVAAGSYALLTIPSDGEWTVILNRDTKLLATGGYRPELDVARVKVRAQAAPHRERLTFLFSDFSDEAVSLDLEWEKRRVRIPIALRTSEQMQGAIKSLDDVAPRYAQIAAYMLETKRDYDQGLEYANKAVALGEGWYNLWIRASLFAAKGDFAAARQDASRAYELGHKAGDAFTLEPTIRRALALWKAPSSAQQSPSLAKTWAEGSPASVEPVRVAAQVITQERSVRIHAEGGSGASKPPGASEIGPLIKKGRSDIQACYQRALRLDPDLTRARITVSISIGVSGTVKGVVLDPPHPSPSLESCLKQAISRWVFPLSPVEYATEFPVLLRGRE
jgi:tetratricopeptide (TPR) repeat protein